QQYDNAQIIQLAHTLIARMLVYAARTPEERANVDWQQVLFHTERGLTYDWGINLQSGRITSNSWITNLLRTNSNSGRLRTDMRLLGPADNSGNYQAWLALPLEQRDRSTITTPDRRITGDTPDSEGAYFRYSESTAALDPARGLYNYSYYQWWRRINEIDCQGTCGFLALASADENRLLRAEALLRTGQTQAAIDLINVSRTRGLMIETTEIPQNL